MSASDKPQPFQLREAGGEEKGWCSMGFMGICTEGPTRQAAWDMLRRAIQATAVVIREAK